MRKFYYYFSVIILLIISFPLLVQKNMYAQLVPTANNNAMQLVQQMVGSGVVILSANLTCPAGASGTYTTSGVCSTAGIPQGVVLTSGSINNVPGPNNTGSAGVDNGAAGNALLDALTGNTTYDACVLTFSFIPTTNSISFNFIFGSEEYPEFVNSSVNDGFGFFLTGPPSYSNTNIAYIPSTTTPITIDNVNASTNSGYYNDNTGGTCLQYDGYTDVITAQANVTPCSTYTMTMAVADAGDGIYDSGVLIQENSFSSGTFDATLVSQTNATCSTLGSATVTASGGTPPYVYQWSTSPVQNTPTATNLSPGNYYCVVSYNICSQMVSDTVYVTINGTGTVSAPVTSQTNVNCNGGNNGSVTVTPSGGTTPYTYSWSPSGGSGPTASSLTAGAYTVTVTDNIGCSGTTTVTITEPAVLTANITATANPTCAGNNGTATVTAGGGAGGYTYTWSPSGGSAATGTGMGAGTYTVTVTDANGCTRTATTTLANSGGPSASITSVTNVSCFGGTNGSATVTVNSGSAPYTYSWSPSGGSAATGTNMTAGTYTVTVTDASSCSSTATVTITQPAQVTANITSSSNVTCFGGSDGTATVTAGGGTIPYSYVWSPSGGNTATGTGLGSNTYTVTVTDANLCTQTATVSITEPAQVVLNVVSQSDPSCLGYTDGTATLNVSGGVGAMTYTWNPGGVGTNTSGTLSAGTYTVTVSDANNCTSSTSFTINDPSGVALSVTPSDDSICVADAIVLNTNAYGGSGGYTYTWNGTPGASIYNDNPVSTTVYNVVLTDINGCTVSASATVYVGSLPNASFTTASVCEGAQTVFNNTSTVTSGMITGYGWDFGDGSPYSNLPSPVYTYTSSGQYNVTLGVVTDFGCTGSVTLPVNVNPVPVTAFTADVLSGCVPLCVNFSDLTNAGGGTVNSWTWQIDGQVINTQHPSYCFNNPGVYDISLAVSTTDGCSGSLTIPGYIQAYPDPIADFTMSSNQLTETAPLVNFTDASTNAVSWSWDFGDGDNSAAQNPSHIYADTGTFCIKLTVSNAAGCTDDVSHCLIVIPEYYIYIPNTFTPNDDKLNDVFLIYGRGIAEATLIIFDRWGEPLAKLLNDQPFTVGWDAKYNGSFVKQDVYTYKLLIKDIHGDFHDYHGHINVIY